MVVTRGGPRLAQQFVREDDVRPSSPPGGATKTLGERPATPGEAPWGPARGQAAPRMVPQPAIVPGSSEAVGEGSGGVVLMFVGAAAVQAKPRAVAPGSGESEALDLSARPKLATLPAERARELAPEGSVFADLARRGGPQLGHLLAMHAVAGTDVERLLIGIGKAYIDDPKCRPNFEGVASQLVATFGLGGALPVATAQARVAQVLLRMVNFHDPSEWARVVPALLDDVAVTTKVDTSATAVEEGLARVSAIRRTRSVGESRNIAFVTYELEPGEGGPVLKGELEAVSGIPRDYPSRGTTVRLVTQVEHPTLGPGVPNNARRHDTEWTLLEHLAALIPRSAQGVVKLFSERPCCPSCQLVMARFQREFPRVELLVATGPANV